MTGRKSYCHWKKLDGIPNPRQKSLFVMLRLSLFCCCALFWSLIESLPIFAQAINQPSSTTFKVPGYSVPVSGRWLAPSQNQSGVTLGGMGVGYLELRPDGKFYDSALQNNWQKPRPPAGCSLTFSAMGETAALLSTAAASDVSLNPTPRYFGHFPIADLDYGRPTSAPITVWLRAYSPFEPQ